MYCGGVLGKSQRIAQAGLVIQMVLPEGLKRLKLQLQSNIPVSNAHFASPFCFTLEKGGKVLRSTGFAI